MTASLRHALAEYDPNDKVWVIRRVETGNPVAVGHFEDCAREMEGQYSGGRYYLVPIRKTRKAPVVKPG